uniref:Pyr_redox_2 domain-containing protein n=1 Tax=Panagrellus redivivus TaxID=6233 RepID=A0A7E4V9X4_PANRE
MDRLCSSNVSSTVHMPDSTMSSSTLELLDSTGEDEPACFIDTEVIIIGNGPAGLSLSTFLSGWLPYYDVNYPHPDARLHDRLAQNATTSLLDQDLSWFEEEFAEIINPSVRPVAFLIDMLMRPPHGHSCLQYVYCPERALAHVVIGATEFGGSWTTYDDEMATVSLANWLDLPGFSVSQWLEGKPLVARLPAGVIREYMKAYVTVMNIESKIRPNTHIETVTKCHDSTTGMDYYTVSGYNSENKPYSMRCRQVILACGQSIQRHLEVPGESLNTNIVYDVASMKKYLHSEQTFMNNTGRVVVVGDGISAADAITHCLNNNLPVVHVMRRSDAQLRSTMLSKLTPSVYPEYARAYKLMIGKEINKIYTRQTQSIITEVSYSEATVSTPKGLTKVPFDLLVVCIGRQSELSFLPEKVEFNADYRCFNDRHMFAVGSVAGDHFIRYLVGGCLQVGAALFKEHNADLKLCQMELFQIRMANQLREVERRQKRLRRKPATRCCLINRVLSTST